MRVEDLFSDLPFGWSMPTNPMAVAWRRWAHDAGESVERALDTCPHPGALVFLVAAVAWRSGNAELAEWHARNMSAFIARTRTSGDEQEILAGVPRELVVRAFNSIGGERPQGPSSSDLAVMSSLLDDRERSLAAAQFASVDPNDPEAIRKLASTLAAVRRRGSD